MIKKIINFLQKFKEQETNYVSLKNCKTNHEKWLAYYYKDTFINKEPCLKNLLGIKNKDELEKIEYKLTSFLGISVKNVKGNFDYQHLKDIHHHFFGKLYSWAGEERVVNMAKIGNNWSFTEPEDINKRMNKILNELKEKNFLSDCKNKEEFANEICHFYLEINETHPFRDGNGRTQNEFFRQLALKNGYILDLQKVFDEFKEKNIKSQYENWFKHYINNRDSKLVLENLFLNNIKEIKKSNLNSKIKEKIDENLNNKINKNFKLK